MALATAGYSGKPLHEKLGLKNGMAAAFIALPAELEALASAVPLRVAKRFASWRLPEGAVARYDLIHAFTYSRAEIEDGLDGLQDAIVRNGAIWVSWPKKISKVATDVDEGVVRGAALELDLVDVKVAAVSEVWSGLKLVIRKDRR